MLNKDSYTQIPPRATNAGSARADQPEHGLPRRLPHLRPGLVWIKGAAVVPRGPPEHHPPPSAGQGAAAAGGH